jgi:hypothetical protein
MCLDYLSNGYLMVNIDECSFLRMGTSGKQWLVKETRIPIGPTKSDLKSRINLISCITSTGERYPFNIHFWEIPTVDTMNMNSLSLYGTVRKM